MPCHAMHTQQNFVRNRRALVAFSRFLLLVKHSSTLFLFVSFSFLKTQHGVKEHLTIVDSRSPKCFDISFVWLIDRLIILSEKAGEEGRLHFFQEIEVMKEIGSHRNIVRMLGYWTRSEPIMLILEYVPHGDLLQWLRNKRLQVSVLLKKKKKNWGTFMLNLPS